MVHMVAERDTDSVAPTPTPQHPHPSQHHHLSLHELRVLQVSVAVYLINHLMTITFLYCNIVYVHRLK